jgi:hypothetical protein
LLASPIHRNIRYASSYRANPIDNFLAAVKCPDSDVVTLETSQADSYSSIAAGDASEAGNSYGIGREMGGAGFGFCTAGMVTCRGG